MALEVKEYFEKVLLKAVLAPIGPASGASPGFRWLVLWQVFPA
jgi:hypothetical protein